MKTIKEGHFHRVAVSELEPSIQILPSPSSDIIKPQKPHPPPRSSANRTVVSGLWLHWKQLFSLTEGTSLPAVWATGSIDVWPQLHSHSWDITKQDQFSWYFLCRWGSLLTPHISAFFEKPMSFPQFPVSLWAKSALATSTSTSDPVYIVKVLFFIIFLMTLVTLLILAYRVFRSKSYWIRT